MNAETTGMAFYTVREMAVITGFSVRWIYPHATDLPGYDRSYGRVLFLRAAVDAAYRLRPEDSPKSRARAQARNAAQHESEPDGRAG